MSSTTNIGYMPFGESRAEGRSELPPSKLGGILRLRLFEHA